MAHQGAAICIDSHCRWLSASTFSDPQVIAVHLHDPEYKHLTDISQVPPHRLAEIRSFFEDYKKVRG